MAMNYTPQQRRRSNSNFYSPQQQRRTIRVNPSSSSFIEDQDHNHDDSKAPSLNTIFLRMKRKMRSRPSLVLLTLLLIAGITIVYLRAPYLPLTTNGAFTNAIKEHANSAEEKVLAPGLKKIEPPHLGNGHPIQQLIKNAEQEFGKVVERQSKTLAEAVTEYRRRYGIPPPPNFDKWYAYAKSKNVQMIDEYDTIHTTLTPFWGLQPKTIRNRAREALGYDANNILGVLIRKGEIKKVDGGIPWAMEATKGMMQKFTKYLPDMDLCFNIHDEPRVVVPYDDLSRLVRNAEDVKMPAANAVANHRNSWSERPVDLTDGTRFEDLKLTRFNVLPHQATWTHSRMSCPPDSPARFLEDGLAKDNFETYAVGELGFIYNKTAFSDICQSPSFSETYGFFDRPNAFNIAHDLFPIFSASKPSSYSDIVYPSPWYWAGKVSYDDSSDMDWAKKEGKLYWRGSTTGGFSRDGGWRRQHRQHLVKKINAGDQAKILSNSGGEGEPEDWKVKQISRSDFKDIFDVHFSHVGQCDPGDCKAQEQFFELKTPADQKEAWKYKYLLDMDGNAFSGRFYAFLKSKSLVYKLAVFREWHEEWLKPWVHYIPLSLRGDEWVEAVRWFAGEAEGKKKAEHVAIQGREWANKVLRNDDLEVWFFRLLLEYGRLVDDNRETIGYTG
ncbi:hypothetical protein WAI453_005102 [Rhynchosporium graminicola]|uniref:Related to capsular associated protein n=1 Tax=Rhynchosporium graminicola TaxID=2792576 RepID=A0A1E1LAM0_9HELO|nr:related to capsular associated protein [Rhynchosporium commune]